MTENAKIPINDNIKFKITNPRTLQTYEKFGAFQHKITDGN